MIRRRDEVAIAAGFVILTMTFAAFHLHRGILFAFAGVLVGMILGGGVTLLHVRRKSLMEHNRMTALGREFPDVVQSGFAVGALAGIEWLADVDDVWPAPSEVLRLRAMRQDPRVGPATGRHQDDIGDDPFVAPPTGRGPDGRLHNHGPLRHRHAHSQGSHQHFEGTVSR